MKCPCTMSRRRVGRAATRTEREKPTVPPENAAAWKKTSPPEVSAPVNFPESRGAGQFSAQAAALKGS